MTGFVSWGNHGENVALRVWRSPSVSWLGRGRGRRAPGDAAGGEIRYTVCLGNLRPAGLVTYRVRPAGEAVVTLSLSDRGRGEALTSHLHLDGAGIPLSEHLTGVDYWKNAIDERFALAHGKAAWSNGPEKGEKAVAGPAFYVTGSGSLLEIGLLATALLESHDHRLPLLPDGEARIEPAGAARVVVGKEARSLTLYALSGLAVSPLYVWMDPSGDLLRPLRRLRHRRPPGLGGGGAGADQGADGGGRRPRQGGRGAPRPASAGGARGARRAPVRPRRPAR